MIGILLDFHRRRVDRVMTVIAVVCIGQLLAVTAWATLTPSVIPPPQPIPPTTATELRVQHDQIQVMMEEFRSLKLLRIDARLSVLEDMKIHVDKIELLVYSTIVGMAGNLFLMILNIKAQKERRR